MIRLGVGRTGRPRLDGEVRLRTFALALCLVLAAGPASAVSGDLVQKVRQGDRSPAVMDALAEASHSGDGRAAEALGFLYATGRGVPRDLPRAFSEYVSAGKAGIPGALANARTVWRSMTGDQRAQVGEALRRRYSAADLADLDRHWSQLADDGFGAGSLEGPPVPQPGDIWTVR